MADPLIVIHDPLGQSKEQGLDVVIGLVIGGVGGLVIGLGVAGSLKKSVHGVGAIVAAAAAAGTGHAVQVLDGTGTGHDRTDDLLGGRVGALAGAVQRTEKCLVADFDDLFHSVGAVVIAGDNMGSVQRLHADCTVGAQLPAQ